MADPPLLAGAVKLTVALAFPAVAVPIVGTPGTVGPLAGVTLLEAVDDRLGPTPLLAVTVKVYAVPLVSPLTVIGLLAPVAVTPPGLDVTV
jgi:hypothetical protein